MKQMKYFVAAALLCLLAACKNENNNLEQGTNQPFDVVVSLNTSSVGVKPRSAMTELPGPTANNAAAVLEKVHVYLLETSGKIAVAQEFVKGQSDWDMLVNTTPISALPNSGGYKFVNVAARAVKAVVVCNPQGAVAAVGTNISAVADYVLKVQLGEVIYADSKPLLPLGEEEFGVNPQPAGTVVKGAEFTLEGNMNRFETTGKFSKISWVTGGEEKAKQWQTDWLAKAENAGKTQEDALNAFKEHVGTFLNFEWEAGKEATWKEFFQIYDVTGDVVAVVMNRFYNKFHVADFTSNELMFARTYADGRYDFLTGTFKPDKVTDVSAAASYYHKDGMEKPFLYEDKVAAFNFFTDQVTDYSKDGNAPTLHFIFRTVPVDGGTGPVEISPENRFVNIKGYTAGAPGTAGAAPLDPDANRAAKILHMDFRNMNNGYGILVEVDPTIPEGLMPDSNGGGDFTDDAVSVILRVEVKPWTVVEVAPAL